MYLEFVVIGKDMYRTYSYKPGQLILLNIVSLQFYKYVIWIQIGENINDMNMSCGYRQFHLINVLFNKKNAYDSVDVRYSTSKFGKKENCNEMKVN